MNREQSVWEQGKTWENYKERGKTFNGIYASKGGGNHVKNRRIEKDRKGNWRRRTWGQGSNNNLPQ